MTYKRTNNISNLLFYIILLSGLAYTLMLGIAFTKVFPGFLMQVIFIFDSIKFNSNLSNLIVSPMFLINVTGGFVLFILCLTYIKAILSLIGSLYSTHRLINSLKHSDKKDDYFIYQSIDKKLFVTGFFKPKIYLTSGLMQIHTASEIKAMLYHEKNHQNNHHPLKKTLIRFIQSLLPPLPGKNWIIENYLIFTEVSSDQFAESNVNSKLPIVSALFKHQNQGLNLIPSVSNFFDSQSERIKVLVGQKRQGVKAPVIYAFLISIFMFISIGFFKNTTVFFNCQHLVNCLKVLITPDSRPLLISQNNTFTTATLTSSDHCQ